MKKKLLTFCLIFIFMFIININDVKGFTCEYGIKESDGDTWESKITLIVTGWESFGLDSATSQVFFDIESSSGYQDVDKKNNSGKYIYLYHIDNGSIGDSDDVYYFYARLYPTEEKYDGKCPETLQYEFTYSDGGLGVDAYTMGIYVDDMAKYQISSGDNKWKELEPSTDAAKKFGFSNKQGHLILKDFKDKPLKEIIDVYNCYTYSSYYNAMADAKSANGGSCDGSKEFKDNYKEIQDLCTAYRSSEDYVEGSGNAAKVPACQKACTALEDDVAELCTLPEPSGFCGSLSEEIVNYIFKLFGFARYIVPVILIILSIIDYIKAIASDSEDEMKKVSGRFAKRLLAAALIFIIPLIIDFILGIFNIPGLTADRPFCE